jgi:hypothetical protein
MRLIWYISWLLAMMNVVLSAGLHVLTFCSPQFQWETELFGWLIASSFVLGFMSVRKLENRVQKQGVFAPCRVAFIAITLLYGLVVFAFCLFLNRGHNPESELVHQRNLIAFSALLIPFCCYDAWALRPESKSSAIGCQLRKL